jgi:2-dehydro-3-deoxygalactonokinase
MGDAALIGVDWGTSNFRAFLIAASGTILDRRSGPHGIMAVAEGRFAQTLAAGIGDWLGEGRMPILMSGMIGSRQGWVEAPYVATPLGVGDLAVALARAPFDAADVHIVPGLRTATDDAHDVIRGEETQVFGALARLGIESGRFLLPGTHSKWVTVEESRITAFATYMTGEIFSAARDHTILGRLMKEGTPTGSAFLRGVAYGAWPGSPGALLHRLFGVRTAGLFGELEPVDVADYLSGLLIGAEIADQGSRDKRPVHIIASDMLAERYRTAAAALGISAEIVPSDCIVDGYTAIARMAGLIAPAARREAS